MVYFHKINWDKVSFKTWNDTLEQNIIPHHNLLLMNNNSVGLEGNCNIVNIKSNSNNPFCLSTDINLSCLYVYPDCKNYVLTSLMWWKLMSYSGVIICAFLVWKLSLRGNFHCLNHKLTTCQNMLKNTVDCSSLIRIRLRRLKEF